MTTKRKTKHQLKSEATRSALLRTAEEIFARDGYDRAQIDEIARASGRTRGAVYAQYKTKEQLFFAVQEHRIEVISRYVSDLRSNIDHDDSDTRWDTVRAAFAGFEDDRSEILDLELKLYGLRHPEAIGDWRERYNTLFPVHSFTTFLGLTETTGRPSLESRFTALAAIKGGLILTRKFLPDQLPNEDVRLILEALFDALFRKTEIAAPPNTEAMG